MVLTVLISVTAGFAFRRRFPGSGLIFYTAIASLIVPGLVLSIGILVTFRYPRLLRRLVQLGARRASLLGAALRPAHHVRRPRPAQPVLRGGGLRPRRQQVADGARGGHPDRLPRHDRGGAVRLHAQLRRVPAELADGRHQEHAAARDLDDDHQRHLAGALRARHGDHVVSFIVIALALGSILIIQRRRST